ncbi:ABC transporter substrate-binding protein [Cycloclasticus sp. 46_120_T64]|nr:ABC transporter substrate-binding protein [Cycloclasticus sp. 46_120_T64]
MSLFKTILTRLSVLSVGLLFSMASLASTPNEIRISVLQFGTINWTLQTILQNQLDTKNGFSLKIQALASSQASKIALQADAADMIAADWTWVARQRGNTADYLFAAYSSSAGSLMVPAQSTITSIDDLANKKLGIAGGALDKNWLLLRALALKNGQDLDQQVKKVFAAPPLLNQLIQQGELDALINFWHYSARLKAKGYREIIGLHDIIRQLGVNKTVPILGYVFRQQWADKQAHTINAFLTASRQASDLLCSSEQHWQAILPLTRTNDPSTQQLLRKNYCAGRVSHFQQADIQAISDIYAILANGPGGDKLLGSVKQLDTKLFWSGKPH